MKVTLNQVQKAINNTFVIGTDGNQFQYEAIRSLEDYATIKVGTDVKKTSQYFTKYDWLRVFREVKKTIMKNEELLATSKAKIKS